MRVPISPASLYDVYISQLICFARASSHVTDFNTRNTVADPGPLMLGVLDRGTPTVNILQT